jgi:RNA polymerase-binding transcription factor DksA
MAVKKKPAVKKAAPKKPAKPVAKKATAKPANKKAAPKSAAKPAVKKAAAKAPAKPAAKKAIAKPVAKKPVSKPAAKPAAKHPAPKAAVKNSSKPVAKPSAKTVSKPAAKPAAKPATKVPAPVAKTAAASKGKATASQAKPAAPAPKAAASPAKPAAAPQTKAVAPAPPAKKGGVDPSSLVSIKPKVKAVVKKEPPRAAKLVIPKTTTKSAVKYEPEFTKSVLDTRIQPVVTGPTQRYSDTDLVEFREIIMRKLDAAKKELNYLQGLITRKDEGGDMDDARYMTMEDGSVSMEREQLSQMASRQITFIDHLEKALMRIESKTYGICRVTGKLIDKARLRAVPHATLSIEAKQMMNK